MKICTRKQLVLLTALCGMLISTLSSAQPYLRYIHPEDLGSKALYADSVLTSIRLPQGVASLANYPKFNVAALELLQIMNDPTKEVMQVYVCGSASPDGLWADNVLQPDISGMYWMSHRTRFIVKASMKTGTDSTSLSPPLICLTSIMS